MGFFDKPMRLIYSLNAGVREFECQSFKEFLAWKEKEEDNNMFYVQSTGRKPLNEMRGLNITQKLETFYRSEMYNCRL